MVFVQVKLLIESLRKLLLLQLFKNCVPEHGVVYLNERTVSTVSQAVVFADEFVLTPKQVFKPSKAEHLLEGKDKPSPIGKLSHIQETRECFYCHNADHIAANCLSL